MEDYLEEDIAIQEERSRPPKVLSTESFARPIEVLCEDRPLPAVGTSTTIAEAVSVMQELHSGAVLVLAEERLAGIVTERDLLHKVYGKDLDTESTPVSAIMTARPHALQKDDTIAYLINAMRVGGFRHVPIVDEVGRPHHLISVRDVLAYIVDRFPEDIINLPPEPPRGSSPPWGG